MLRCLHFRSLLTKPLQLLLGMQCERKLLLQLKMIGRPSKCTTVPRLSPLSFTVPVHCLKRGTHLDHLPCILQSRAVNVPSPVVICLFVCFSLHLCPGSWVQAVCKDRINGDGLLCKQYTIDKVRAVKIEESKKGQSISISTVKCRIVIFLFISDQIKSQVPTQVRKLR